MVYTWISTPAGDLVPRQPKRRWCRGATQGRWIDDPHGLAGHGDLEPAGDFFVDFSVEFLKLEGR